MKKPVTAAQREAARCEFLHQLCVQVSAQVASGTPAKDAIRAAAQRRRAQLFRHGRLSRSRLTVLFYAWRRRRGPEVFHRRYVPGKPRVPGELLLEFLSRLAPADQVVRASVVMQSLRSDWSLGRSLPGLGTWREYLRLHRGADFIATVPPRFPVSYCTMIRALEGGQNRDYQRKMINALRAQATLSGFYAFIDSRRTAVAVRMKHVPIGTHSPSAPPTHK